LVRISITLNNLYTTFIGYDIILNTNITILFITSITLTEILIINLLKNNIYITIPKRIPTNMYALNCPLLNTNNEYITITAEITQNKVSSIYVTKLGVLKLFRSILKMSKTIPIRIPFSINIKNK